jgi:peptidylprolyl isomerase
VPAVHRLPLPAALLALGLVAVPALAVSGAVFPVAASASSNRSVPAVANAKNLKVAPVVSPGKLPAPTKLVTKDLVVGTGATATATNTVGVKYVGANYVTGKDFTNGTWTSGETASFPLSGVVPGFSKGIVGMKVGGRREIVIPPSLGYKNQGFGTTIKPNETLVFVVDLKSVS